MESKIVNPKSKITSGIKGISIDAGGTLIQLKRPVGDVYAEVAEEQGIVLDPQAATAAFRHVWKSLPDRADGERPDDDAGFWAHIVHEVLRRNGVNLSSADFDRFFAAAYERYRGAKEWALYPEVLEVVSELSKRFPIAVTSNYDLRLVSTLEELGVSGYFRKIIVSSVVGADKPSPRIFNAATEALELDPGEVLHIGDEEQADFHGARNAGLNAWLVRRPETDLRELLAG